MGELVGKTGVWVVAGTGGVGSSLAIGLGKVLVMGRHWLTRVGGLVLLLLLLLVGVEVALGSVAVLLLLLLLLLDARGTRRGLLVCRGGIHGLWECGGRGWVCSSVGART